MQCRIAAIIFFSLLTVMTCQKVKAQQCEFVKGKLVHNGNTVKESKWRKTLKTSIQENYTIKLAKLGDVRLIAMNISVVPKFSVYQDNRLAIHLANGKKIGLKTIKDFKSSTSKTNGRERAKVYYVVNSEHYKLLANVKIKKIHVDMGPRYTDIQVKPDDQEQLLKAFRCLK